MDSAYRQLLVGEGLSEAEIEYLEEYEESLPGEAVYRDFDIDEVVHKMIMGDRLAGNELILVYMRRVVEEAIAQREDGVSITELISEGNLALAETVAALIEDPTRMPRDLDEHLNDVIWDGMRSYVNSTKQTEYAEAEAVQRANALLDSIDKLTRELGFKPNIDEIANDMGISQEEVVEILKMTGEEPEQEK